MQLLAILVKSRDITKEHPIMYWVGDALYVATADGRWTADIDVAWLKKQYGIDVCDDGLTEECKAAILVRAIKDMEATPQAMYANRQQSIDALATVLLNRDGIPVFLSYRGRSAVLIIPNEFGPHPDRDLVIEAYKEEKGIP